MAARREPLPIQYDHIFYYGDTFKFVYVVKNPDGTPMDNTDWDVVVKMKTTPDGTEVDTFSTEDGDIVLGGITGKVTWTVPKSVIATYLPKVYTYDLQETYPDTSDELRFSGSINVVKTNL